MGMRRRKQLAVVGERRRREREREREREGEREGEREREKTRMGQNRVGGIERVRGRGSYGTALTFDLISLPASLETSCRPLPRAYLEPRLYFVTDSSARLSRRRVVVVREKYKGGKRETNFWTLRILFVYYYWCESACVTYIDMFSMFRQCISYRRDTQM